uniref:MYND-type domain-containing protein n=1 Tax=Strigamia maritima TaxID=126957 RepID=T1IGY3_STRMM
MKFIQLSKHKETTPYDMIMQFGCGPNFVLNRSKRFKSMIKEQGEKFWFRFWLLFCLKPGCHDLTSVSMSLRMQELWPEMTYYVYLCIHEIFLQDSLDQVTKYCLNEVIKPMLTISADSKINTELRLKTASVDKIQDVVIKSVSMAFGAALCEIFFKWLEADEVDKNTDDYWTIPEEYLDPKFKPSLLEEFLVAEWKNKLSVLLGVEEDRIPWLKRLMASGNSNQPQLQMNKNGCRHDSLDFICQMSDFMNRNRNRKKYELRNVDELPYAKSANASLNMTPRSKDKLKNQKLKNFEKNVTTSTTAKTKVKECAYCWSAEDSAKKFKKCKRCVDEKWSEPRYYCNQNCQIADWKELHHEEHLQFRTKNGLKANSSSSDNAKERKEKNNLYFQEKLAIFIKLSTNKRLRFVNTKVPNFKSSSVKTMRFIPLGKESPKVADCYVWSVKKFGCGGNFVLNRKDKFERMIKDQIHFANKKGIECDICSMAIDLHKQFLEVSEKERIQFSISVVKRILTPRKQFSSSNRCNSPLL